MNGLIMLQRSKMSWSLQTLDRERNGTEGCFQMEQEKCFYVFENFVISLLRPHHRPPFRVHSLWLQGRGQKGPGAPTTWLRTSSLLLRSWQPSCSLCFYSHRLPASKEEALKQLRRTVLKSTVTPNDLWIIKSVTYSPQVDLLLKLLLSLKYHMNIELKDKREHLCLQKTPKQ